MPGKMMCGLASGAAGSAALNIATYLDIAIRGRAPSSVPSKDVERLASEAGVELGSDEQTAEHRKSGLGALMGYASGLTVAAAYAMLRPLARDLPLPLAAPLVGAAAMAATDTASTMLGTADPRKWSTKSWAVDIVPHLAYGATTVLTYEALSK